MSRALGTKPSWIDKFISVLLSAADTNVIAVDWVYGSTGLYPSAVENVVKLSLEISRFLHKLLVGAEEPGVTLGVLVEEGGVRKKQHMRTTEGRSRATLAWRISGTNLDFDN